MSSIWWKLKASLTMVGLKLRFEYSLAKLKFWAWWLTLDWVTINAVSLVFVCCMAAAAWLVVAGFGLWYLVVY